MPRRERARARHAWKYPPEQRGRRILWRTITIGLYLILTCAVAWYAHLRRWTPSALIAPVAVPYWAAVTALWRRHGPYMPKLHGDREPARTGTVAEPPRSSD